MDDLRSRLKEMGLMRGLASANPSQNSLKQGGGGRPDGRIPSLREQLERIEKGKTLQAVRKQESGPRERTLEEVLKGRVVDSARGRVFEVNTSYNAGCRHGKYKMEDFFHIDTERLDLFCGGKGQRKIDREDFLFLDLETTGLSLGTGTYAFLVGMGYFHQEKYHIKQLFLRGFDEEQAMIFRFKEIVDSFPVLVTFNGKRFDVPVLETRFSLCGSDMNIEEKVHWDLLYPSRRFWKDRQENCRLETIERKQLGVEREGQDIPGERIPEIYFRYVHEGITRDLDRIVYHNAMDILSLTSLVIHADRSLKEMDPLGVNLVSIGRFLENKGKTESGRHCYETMAGSVAPGQERDEAIFHLALCMKREGNRRESITLWEELIERGRYRLLDCCEEAAKYHEHETREFEKAIQLVERALQTVSMSQENRRSSLERRLSRLENKRGAICGK
jgi:uncharacterized protein